MKSISENDALQKLIKGIDNPDHAAALARGAQAVRDADGELPPLHDDEIDMELISEMVIAAYQENGYPLFSSFTFEHMSKEEEARMSRAISVAQKWVERYRRRPGIGMIIIADPIQGDAKRTGVGCGKTMLANAARYGAASITVDPAGSVTIYDTGSYIEARDLMSLFDKNEIDHHALMRMLRPPVILDDVGREGTLPYEKRDEDLQLLEKQSRYYSVINHCYLRDISLIITSNLSGRKLAQFLGAASWSRLGEMVPMEYRVNLRGIPDMRPMLGEKMDDTDF